MKIFIVVLFLSSSFLSFSQKIGPGYLPPKTNDMPEWFSVFYQGEAALKATNVFELEKKVETYIANKKANLAETARATGIAVKEDGWKDGYINYFKRWRKFLGNNVNENGGIEQKNAPVVNVSVNIPQTANQSVQRLLPNNAWTHLGPEIDKTLTQHFAAQPQRGTLANVYSFAVAPSNHDILYASCEAGGLYKTIDKGLNWSLVHDWPSATGFDNAVSTYRDHAFFAVAVHPTNANIVYGVKNNVVEKSIDGGVTFTRTTNTAWGYLNAIEIDPINPDVIIAAGDKAIARSTNGGTTWSTVTTLSGSYTYDLKFNAADPNIVYAIRKTSTGFMQFLKSTNNGATFSISTPSGWPSSLSVESGRMAVTVANSNYIYLVFLAQAPSNAVPHIYKSTDGGSSFVLMCTGTTGTLQGTTAMPLGMSNGLGFYAIDIEASAVNADLVFANTTSIYRSIDGGASFTAFGGYRGGFNGTYNLHPDIQQVVSLGAETWIATDGGMYYSTDNFTTANYQTRSKGLISSDFWGFTQGWNEDVVGGGRYHNGNVVMSENYPPKEGLSIGGGESPTGHYMFGKPYHMLFDDIGGGQVLPEQFSGKMTKFNHANLYPSYNVFGLSPSELEVAPHAANIMYLGNDSDFYKSEDSGVHYSIISSFPNGVRRFEISRSNHNVIYLATTNGLYKSTNGGTSFIALTTPAAAGTNFYNLNISIDAFNENILWIAGVNLNSNNRIFKSTDGGNSWTNLSTPIINTYGIRSLVHQFGTDGGVYVFMEGNRVFYRNNTMADWEPYNIDMPIGTYPLTALAFYRDHKIRMAGNRGIWENKLAETPTTLAVQPMVVSNKVFCVRDTVYYDDFSAVSHENINWNWTFPGAIWVSSTTVRNPKVIYGAAGTYSATLSITNIHGTNNKTETNIVTVLNSGFCSPDTIPGKAYYAKTNLATSSYAYAKADTKMPGNSAEFTASFWVKPAMTQVDRAGIFSFWHSARNYRLFLKYPIVGDSVLLAYTPDESWNSKLYLHLGKWNHVAMVVNATTTTLYVNGKKSTNTGRTNPVLPETNTLYIGNYQGVEFAWYFEGAFDELSLYKTALDSNEVRRFMHITKENPNRLDQHNPNIVAYYQFNETEFTAFGRDRIGNAHMSFVGTGSNKDSVSTAPVGGGVSQKITIPAAAAPFIADYQSTGVKIAFGNGTKPAGDVWVSRIFVPADVFPENIILPNAPKSYYAINNVAENKIFAPVDSIVFYNVEGVTPTMAATPSFQKLYKRNTVAHDNIWGASIVDASETGILANGTGSIKFSTGLNLTNFSQFTIASGDILSLSSITLRATALQNAVDLTWETVNEKDNKHFVIERSKNGTDWLPIKTVLTKGDFAGTQYYNVKDENVPKTVLFYRIKVVDKQLAQSYSNIRLVNLSESKIKLSPNPVVNVLTIAGWDASKGAVKIMDVSGKEISNNTMISYSFAASTTIVNLSGLAAGIYFVKVGTETLPILKK